MLCAKSSMYKLEKIISKLVLNKNLEMSQMTHSISLADGADG